MNEWIINLIKIGRSRVNRTIHIKAKTLPEVEQRAIKECLKYLMSRDVGLCDNKDLTYTVRAGFRPVGFVKIKIA